MIERDFVSRHGTLDLIARSERMLLVCELCQHLSPGAAETPRPDRRALRLATGAWLIERGRRSLPAELRFDRITVHLNRSGELVGLEHQPDAH